MSSLTLKNIPETTLKRLRIDAERERRSLNQHALYLLEQSLGQRELSFGDALTRFRARPEKLEGLAESLDGLRDRSTEEATTPRERGDANCAERSFSCAIGFACAIAAAATSGSAERGCSRSRR